MQMCVLKRKKVLNQMCLAWVRVSMPLILYCILPSLRNDIRVVQSVLICSADDFIFEPVFTQDNQ